MCKVIEHLACLYTLETREVLIGFHFYTLGTSEKLDEIFYVYLTNSNFLTGRIEKQIITF